MLSCLSLGYIAKIVVDEGDVAAVGLPVAYLAETEVSPKTPNESMNLGTRPYALHKKWYESMNLGTRPLPNS